MVFSDQSTASRNYSGIFAGTSNSISGGQRGVIVGGSGNIITSGDSAFVTNRNNQSKSDNTSVFGTIGLGYLVNQQVVSGNYFDSVKGNSQCSTLVASKFDDLTTGGTTVLSLDGTGTTNLIIPTGTNRVWNVVASWSAIVTGTSGTTTGVNVGDVITQSNAFAFKKIGGTSSIVGSVTDLATHSDSGMSTASMGYSAGASQELALTFTAPTFSGGGSVTLRIVNKIMLTEVAY